MATSAVPLASKTHAGGVPIATGAASSLKVTYLVAVWAAILGMLLW
jgi:hypothetical protein